MNKILIDKVEAIKEIGKGGFGVVYLAKDENGLLYALKKVGLDSSSYAKKELRALQTYQKFVAKNKAENLIEILDIKITDEEISYLMPLADGVEDTSPLAENWQAQTLKTYVEKHYAKGEVFTKDDVLEIFLPLVETVAKLNEAGIVHRDIKPENIIFIKGKIYLADIGLIREDSYSVSSAGTPMYTAPSWYTKNSGKVDMWGLASTLYFFLSGNSPDSMGRSNYMYPKHKAKMPKEDIKAWAHFHNVIFRATREKAAERYIDFCDLIESVKNTDKKQIDVNSPNYSEKESSIFWIKGRINKSKFALCFALFYCLSFLCLLSMSYDSLIGDLAIVAAYLFKYLGVVSVVKRLHDANLSGYWAIPIYFASILIKIPFSIYFDLYLDINDDLSYYSLLAFNSLVMVFVLLACLCFKSDKSTNRFGVPNQKLKLF